MEIILQTQGATNNSFPMKGRASDFVTILIRQNKSEVGHHVTVLLICEAANLMCFQRRTLLFALESQKKKSCPDILSDHSWNFIRHWQIVDGQCLMSNCYLQP